MACSLRTSEVVLEAANVVIGKENVVCIGPVAGLVGGESFLVSNTTENFQVWFSVAAAGIAPIPANGETLVEVALPAAYTAAQASTLIKTALETIKAFYCIVDPVTGNSVALEGFLIGTPLTLQSDVDSGFTLSVLIAGSSEDLGDTAEGIEVAFETTVFDINSNQSGTLVLDQIIQGVASTLSMGLQEVSKTRLETIIGNGVGGIFTPTAGTSMVGFGTSKNFQSSFDNAFRLILHPVRKAVGEREEDFTYWRTLPQVESINYSGTDKKVLNVSFTALNDERKPTAISVCSFGDSEQYLV